MDNEALYLIDCYGLIYRAYFAFANRPLRDFSGENVQAAFGFFRMLFSLLDDLNPQYIAAVMDSRGPTFRHKMYPAYKQTRQKTPEDLHAQVPIVEELLRALGVPLLMAEGFEADDVIATLARRAANEGRPCYVVSGDKDLLQLVGGEVRVLKPSATPTSRAGDILGREKVKEEWGVWPEQILDYLSLTGDASDNVAGVAGIGDKTAQKLLNLHPTLDEIYAHLDEIAPEGLKKKLADGKESAYFSRSLIELRYDVPLDYPDCESLKRKPFDRDVAAALFLKRNMKSLAEKTGSVKKDSMPPGLFDESPGTGQPGTKAERPGPAPASRDAAETGPDGETAADGSAAPEGSPEAGSPAVRLHESPEAAALRGRLSSLPKGNYELVDTPAALASWVARCAAAGSFAFDCETTSLDTLEAEPVGFSLSVEPGSGCYVPLRSCGEKCMDEEEAKSALRQLLENPKLTLIAQNGKYDYQVMKRFGVEMKNLAFDTMVAAWLVDSGLTSYSLESLAERYFGYHGIEFDEVVEKGATFDSVPLDKAVGYAAEDADLTMRLFRYQSVMLADYSLGKLLGDIEMPLVPILAEMELAGIVLEPESLASFSIELEKNLASVQFEIFKLCGHEFNIASPKQLQEVLFVERKLKTGKKTKTGYSTDTSVLEELAQDDPVPELILRHRALAKLKSTYVDALPLMRAKDGRVHTHYVQTGTATGRISSKDPNLQNIPIRDEEGRRIRAAFVAPEGFELISADYSQIELVVLAHLSGDPGLTAAFMEGKDVHRRTAGLIFGIPEEEVTGEQRRMSKTINFGVMYGMSAFRLSNELKIPRKDAQDFIDRYFATYAGIRGFIDKTVAEAEKTGYVETLFGRRRTIETITSRNKTEKMAAERMAVNTPIQGTAADIVKLAMIRVSRALKAEGLKTRLLLQVHDELILESPLAEVEAASAMVKREMEAAVKLDVPLRAAVEHGKSWGDFH
jgi:DNA polymerase I